MDGIIGLVPRVEAQVAHHEFIRSARPSAILVDIVDARKLAETQGETAHSYCGDETSVITTTTVSDEQLNLISWQRELDISWGDRSAFPLRAGVEDG